MSSDIEIARAATTEHITAIAAKLGIPQDAVLAYGPNKAKVSMDYIASLRGKVHTWQGLPLIVTYHPAYLLRSLSEKAHAWEDLCFAVETMQGLQSRASAPT